MYGDDNGSEGPRGTFEIYRAEADSLYKQGEYRKAIESYTLALELTPGEKNCLVARSRCHLQLGDMISALNDAEASLEDDKDYHKGIYQKAQALYYQGDFEMALVFYHRGHKLRPELQEFRLGIQKAQEAIDNSVGCKSTDIVFPNMVSYKMVVKSSKASAGSFQSLQRRKSDWTLDKVLTSHTSLSTSAPPVCSLPVSNNISSQKAPDTVKLTTEGDLTYFDNLQDDKKIKRKTMTYGRPAASQYSKSPAQRVAVGSEKTIKQLLGELYGDRQYLEKLLKETDPNSEMGKTISTLVNDGLSYLDTRSDFWRQQKPMYARRHDRLMQRRKRETSSNKMSPNDYIIKELEKIDQAQVDGRYQEALKRSQKCLSTVQGFTEDEVPNKVEVIANIHSCIGNAYLEMGAFDKALDSHQTDLHLGEANDMVEAVSRGLDNIGRVYARKGTFAQAIEVWERKLPMSKSPLESTWLYHEIGRCYLELDKFAEAKTNGERSENAAIEAGDQMWQLQALVLTAQAEVKLAEFQAAVATFEKASELAKTQGDKSAETAIKKAIEEINSKIIADGVASQDINDNQNVGEKDTNENMNAAEQQGGQTEEQTADTSKEDNSKTENRPPEKDLEGEKADDKEDTEKDNNANANGQQDNNKTVVEEDKKADVEQNKETAGEQDNNNAETKAES